MAKAAPVSREGLSMRGLLRLTHPGLLWCDFAAVAPDLLHLLREAEREHKMGRPTKSDWDGAETLA